MAMKKKGPLMIVGGADGMRLTRAAFAVIIKFSEQATMFISFWDSVEMANMETDTNMSENARMTEIEKKVKETCDVIHILSTQWEQASQIRRWTQEMKKDLTEAYKSTCIDEMYA